MSNSKKITAEYTHYVVAAYDSPYGERGTIVSRHKSQEAAEKAMRNDGGWLCIKTLSELDQ